MSRARTPRWPSVARAFCFCAASLSLLAAMPQQLGAQKPAFPDIKNFLWLSDGNATGGQPRLDDLAGLKAAGVKSVLDLRTRSEFNEPEEAQTARRLGLRYFLIPVDPAHPTPAEVEEFLDILSRPRNRPAFIHCRTADRVGAFWMIRRVLVDHWPLARAEREARRIGLTRDNLRTFALAYIRQHQKRRDSRP